ncbi:hypothetical protein CROQUDRAFT_99042 [Cronartium quercuum f. sp. fusiforme G11]|uniref:Uncharacterized protein n=1 Tax=Cronartium quercuum f. sp. fusiforme G11 TaxID=708437 RepID=A0A9P6T776_9BASI|nr:hypothetical protein CROQUDRAFT_99042 [Cronartium quercuum f. sp. fusiforme G11]
MCHWGGALSEPDLDLCGSIKSTVAIPSSFSGTSLSHPHPSATSFSTSYNSSDTDQW